MWKEFLLLSLFPFILFNFSHLKQTITARKEVFFGGVFFVVIVLASLLYGGILGFGELLALRLELLLLFSILIGVGLSKSLEKEKYDSLISLLIYSTFGSILIGLALYFFIGGDFLRVFGYRNDWSTYLPGEALAFCQRIENSELCRFQGFLSGPNQLGSFLVMVFGLNAWKKPKGYLLIGFTVLLGIILSMSRSAYLATFVMIGLFLVWFNREFIKKNYKWILGVGAGVIMIGIFAFSEQITLVLDRPGSNSERLRLWMEGWNFWKEKFWLGHGLGASGPASRYSEFKELIPENWFLQIGGQFGLVGLISYIFWYFTNIRDLIIDKKAYLAIVWLVLLIPLNLLHVFESSSLVVALGLTTGLSYLKDK